MYSSVGYGQAEEHYRSMDISSRVESADPHSLVAILYDELLSCIDVIGAAAARGQPLAGNKYTHRARAILVALRSGLDFASGGDLALMLASVYAAVSEELEARVSDGDVARIGELRSAIESVAHAWDHIAG